MRHRSFIYLALLMFLVTGSGCEKYINYVNSPVFEQKLVITSFISPSDTISNILVSSNQPLYSYSENLEDPGELSGTISDGTSEIELDTTSYGLSFSHDRMPLIPGKTYAIKIWSDKGLYAEARATVPQEREILINIDTISQDVNNYMPGVELNINIELTDYPGEKNYYNVISYFIAFRSKPKSNPVLLDEYFIPQYWFDYIDDKKARPDNKIKLDTRIVPSISDYDSAFLKIIILNTEESFYLYHTSKYDYGHSDNPFSEAKPVYSNIDGGLGIFTSYTIDSLQFRLK